MGNEWKTGVCALFWVASTLIGSAQVLENKGIPTRVPITPSQIDAQTEDHADRAFNFNATYIVEALSNVNGGLERHGATLGNLNLVFDLETDQSMGLRGGSLHAYLLANHGGSFSQYVGDFQTISHIEAPPAVSLLEAYYQQKLLDDRLSILAGLYALDSEFDTRECAGLFVHSSAGTGADIGQLGVNGPGIYPVGGLALRLRYEDNGWYGQGAVVEGIPGDPDHFAGTTLRLDPGEGVLAIGEVGHIWEDETGPLGKAALGAWGFTRPHETLLDPAVTRSNRGAYLSLEKTFSRELDDPSQGLAGYLRFGVADGSINPIQTYLGLGAVYTGPFEGRPQDQVGLGVYSGLTSSDLVREQGADGHETNIELTYSFRVTQNVTLQPDLQYVINPGFGPKVDNALVLGLRAVISVDN